MPENSEDKEKLFFKTTIKTSQLRALDSFQ